MRGTRSRYWTGLWVAQSDMHLGQFYDELLADPLALGDGPSQSLRGRRKGSSNNVSSLVAS